ncbi:MAG: hypothetical protein KC910_13640 [Candidatus Eremiobacteraeota bacterium]|nr:hypothetical protein [Candidatus Eremiobacteraeota bacterium]
MQIVNHRANSYTPPQGSPPSGTNPYEFRPQNPAQQAPPAPQCPWDQPTETFTPSASPSPCAPQSLGRSTWNGAKKGALWGTVGLGAVSLASALITGQVDPQTLMELGVGAAFSGTLVGGTVGAVIGAGEHLLAK